MNYIVRNRSEEERTTFIRPFQEALRTEKTQKPIEEDEERRRNIFSMVLKEIKGLGEGSDKGRLSCGSHSIITDGPQEAEGFFNLVYSHLFTLFPPESPSQKQYLYELLKVISTSPSENTPLKYRLCVKYASYLSWSYHYLLQDCQICTTPYQERRLFDCLFMSPF